jgi:hypothetical protein
MIRRRPIESRSPLDRRQDRLQHAVEIAIDVVVADARDSIALRAPEARARLVAADFIVRRMRRAVHIDHEFGLATDEIGEIGSDRLLPHEFEPVEPPRASGAKAGARLPFALDVTRARDSSREGASRAWWNSNGAANRPAPRPIGRS